MYIHSKPIAAFYKLGIGTVSLFLEWYLLSQFGWNALRLFPTWVLFIAAIYYLSSALYLATSHQKETGKNLCPMLEGMIILGFLTMSGVALAADHWHFYLPSLPSVVIWLICPILSVLTLLDWLLFVKKGRWRIMTPFYWLALPFGYAGTMFLTAEWMHENATLRYPLEIFNYLEFGLLEMVQCLLGFFVLAIIVAYILYIVDFVMSGKLSKYIVLPHIRIVEVDAEEVESAITTPDTAPKPANPIRQPEADTMVDFDTEDVTVTAKSPKAAKSIDIVKKSKPTVSTTKPDVATKASPEAKTYSESTSREDSSADSTATTENLAKLATPKDNHKSAKNFHKPEAQKADKIEVIRIKMNTNKPQARKNVSHKKRRSSNNSNNRRASNSQPSANNPEFKTTSKPTNTSDKN